MKYTCNRCSWHGKAIECVIVRLVAQRPIGHAPIYQAEDWGTVKACPKCKTVESSLDQACDEPGCKLVVCQGYPTTDGGYRQTCGKHGPGEAKP